MQHSTNLHIRTSGWHYRHWKGPFYPDDLPPSRFLPYYAERLHSAEINNSFYRLPEIETLHAWRDAVPEDFVFAVKASRYITRMKKLKDPQESLRNLYERADTLGDTLGPILFQLYCYFDNDEVGYAAQNALALEAMRPKEKGRSRDVRTKNESTDKFR